MNVVAVSMVKFGRRIDVVFVIDISHNRWILAGEGVILKHYWNEIVERLNNTSIRNLICLITVAAEHWMLACAKSVRQRNHRHIVPLAVDFNTH